MAGQIFNYLKSIRPTVQKVTGKKFQDCKSHKKDHLSLLETAQDSFSTSSNPILPNSILLFHQSLKRISQLLGKSPKLFLLLGKKISKKYSPSVQHRLVLTISLLRSCCPFHRYVIRIRATHRSAIAVPRPKFQDKSCQKYQMSTKVYASATTSDASSSALATASSC